VTLHETDLLLISLAVIAGCIACCALLFFRLKRIVSDSNLKVAERMAALDDAVRALETRLSESYPTLASTEFAPAEALSASEQEFAEAGESEIVSAEIQAVIAAAAVATLGETAAIRSIRSLPAHAVSPWSQQGRAMVQGSHNLRVRR
jgi:hypothetical protein